MALSQINLGDVPNWILVFITLVAVISAGGIWKIERDRDTERRNEKRRSQAALVSAWAVVEEDGPEEHIGDEDSENSHYVVVICNNGSNQPIYKIALFLFIGSQAVGSDEEVDLIPPNKQHHFRLTPYDVTLPEDWKKPSEYMTYLDAHLALIDLGIEIQFTDAENRRWSRGMDGHIRFIEVCKNGHWFRGEDGLLRYFENGKDLGPVSS